MDGPLWVFFSKHQNTTQRQTSLPLGPFSGYTRGQIAQRQTSLPLGPFSGYTRGQTTQRRQAFPWEWERSTNTGSVAATIMLMTTIATPSNIPPTATYPQANTSDVSTLISWGGLAGEKYGGSSWSRNREWWGGGVQSGQSCCAMWCWPRSTNSHWVCGWVWYGYWSSVSSCCLCYTKDYTAALVRLHALLKPGGKIVLYTVESENTLHNPSLIPCWAS